MSDPTLHEISCKLARVWKGASDSCKALSSSEQAYWDSFDDAADLLEVAFDDVNTKLYELGVFVRRMEEK